MAPMCTLSNTWIFGRRESALQRSKASQSVFAWLTIATRDQLIELAAQIENILITNTDLRWEEERGNEGEQAVAELSTSIEINTT